MEQPYNANASARIITATINGIVALAALFLLITRVDNYLRIKAIHEYGQIAQYRKDLLDDKAQIFYPIDSVYKSCLKDKNIK